MLFVVTAAIFYLRLLHSPTRKILTDAIPWRKYMFALYASSFLILIRCVFRLVEYAQGRTGYLMSNEVFLYLFDSVLMLGTMITFAIIHPSEVNALLGGEGS